MFSDEKVIEASRDFVCVRIESYESEANQKIVRSHLGGRFENTAFCVLAPDGEERLTRSGRGPHQVSRNFDGIARIAEKYTPKGDIADSRVPDFNSVKLALNVASADQRVLVLVVGDAGQVAAAEKRLRGIAWDKDLVGRFHYDLETDAEGGWADLVSGDDGGEPGIYLVAPDEFGLEGAVFERLDLDLGEAEIKASMLGANQKYAGNTDRKVYSEHVSKGRRTDKRIEMPMEYGEDRDGDGKIDHRGGMGRR